MLEVLSASTVSAKIHIKASAALRSYNIGGREMGGPSGGGGGGSLITARQVGLHPLYQVNGRCRGSPGRECCTKAVRARDGRQNVPYLLRVPPLQ